MTDGSEYIVEVALPDFPAERPFALWRRAGERWQYWSLIDWSWHDRTADDAVSAPSGADVQPISRERAEALTADRQGWVQYWVVYPVPGYHEPDEPITVLRRRSSPEALEDEVFSPRRRWRWTDDLIRAESGGYSSDVPPLVPIDRAEAEAILRRTHQVTGATEL